MLARCVGCSITVRGADEFVFTAARMFKEALSKSGRRILKVSGLLAKGETWESIIQILYINKSFFFVQRLWFKKL